MKNSNNTLANLVHLIIYDGEVHCCPICELNDKLEEIVVLFIEYKLSIWGVAFSESLDVQIREEAQYFIENCIEMISDEISGDSLLDEESDICLN